MAQIRTRVTPIRRVGRRVRSFHAEVRRLKRSETRRCLGYISFIMIMVVSSEGD